MTTVARAHTDTNGRRWHIGEKVKPGEHPDIKTHPWLFTKTAGAKRAKTKTKG